MAEDRLVTRQGANESVNRRNAEGRFSNRDVRNARIRGERISGWAF